MKIVQIFLGISGLIVLAGCASSQRRYTYSPPTRSYDYNAANAALETTVRAEVNRYGDLVAATPDLRIHARDGVVTLRGSVPSERERQMVDDVVRNTAGVVAVNDELQVAYPPTGVTTPRLYSRAPAPVISTPPPVVVPAPTVTASPPSLEVKASTAAERQTADRILDQFHADSIPATWVQNVNITVRGDDIYLQGYVADAQIHQSLLDSLKRIAGVRTVVDELQVR